MPPSPPNRAEREEPERDSRLGEGTSRLDAELPYFAVTVRKFAIMSFMTWGLYSLYWMYQQWRRIRDRTGSDLSPFWRTFFSIFWVFDLFKRIRDDAMASGRLVDWGSGYLGAAYIVLTLVWLLPDPWSLVGLSFFAPMVPVVQTIEQVNRAHPSQRNDEFTGANIGGIIVGGLFMLLVLIGFLVAPFVR